MLADLVHHIRSELSPSQLLKTVYIYSRNLHDATLAPSIQTMCGKLLLNLIDCIIKIPNKEEGMFAFDKEEACFILTYDNLIGRRLLMRILDAFASKFAALNIQFPTYLRQYKRKKLSEEGEESTESKESGDFDFDKARSIHTATFIPDSVHDGIKGNRNQDKMMRMNDLPCTH